MLISIQSETLPSFLGISYPQGCESAKSQVLPPVGVDVISFIATINPIRQSKQQYNDLFNRENRDYYNQTRGLARAPVRTSILHPPSAGLKKWIE